MEAIKSVVEIAIRESVSMSGLYVAIHEQYVDMDIVESGETE